MEKIPVRAFVFVATPCYSGTVASDYAAALTLAAIHCARRSIFLEPVFVSNCSLVDLARNYLVAEFLATKHATHLFWIDDDLGFSATAIAKIVERDLDCVAGVYTTKADDKGIIYPYTPVGDILPNGLQRAERVPGGFMCLKRHVVEKMVANCTEWANIEMSGKTRKSPLLFFCRNDVEGYVGEDFTFCEKLNHLGIPIWVETDINFLHYGRRGWPANLAKSFGIESQDPSRVKGREEAYTQHAAMIEKRLAQDVTPNK